jgi:hypothetical protein
LGTSAIVTVNGGEGKAADTAISGDGGNGGNGGRIVAIAHTGIENNGMIDISGGNGGNATPVTIGELSTVGAGAGQHLEENADGKDGGNGGNGGYMYLQYASVFRNNGLVQSLGGNGGHGGHALAINPLAQTSWAFGADGGDGGYGGFINFTGGSAPALANGLQEMAGVGGMAGVGLALTPGNSHMGNVGHIKDDGEHVYHPLGFCAQGCDNAPGSNPILPFVPSSLNDAGQSGNLLSSNLTGLFQNNRPVFTEPVNAQIPPLMLAMGQSKMFLARTYNSVTQEILALALREYTRLLATGSLAQKAQQETLGMLQRAGVDREIAQALLVQIRGGKLSADRVVVNLLTQIAHHAE